MGMKNFNYIGIDGQHFPDVMAGSDTFHELDFSPWIDSEKDFNISLEWTLPEGVVSSGNYTVGAIGSIKLSPIRAGFYTIKCLLKTERLVNLSVFKEQRVIETILRAY